MKASELIKKLQDAITQFGDMDILVLFPGDGWGAKNVAVWADPPSDLEKEQGINGTIEINVW